jgi:tetratricopeptide (TPR) repeat protein
MIIGDLKRKLSSLNEIIYFDSNQFLREKSSNPSKLKQVIDEAESVMEKSSGEEDMYFLYGTLGNLYRIYGQPKKAIHYLTMCNEYAIKNFNSKKEIVSLIRLGEALKYDNKQNEALIMFNKAIDKCLDNNEAIYLDFALQHKGKCLMELSKLDEAEKCLLEAFKLRKLKCDTELIDSTQEAIDLVNKFKNTLFD